MGNSVTARDVGSGEEFQQGEAGPDLHHLDASHILEAGARRPNRQQPSGIVARVGVPAPDHSNGRLECHARSTSSRRKWVAQEMNASWLCTTYRRVGSGPHRTGRAPPARSDLGRGSRPDGRDEGRRAGARPVQDDRTVPDNRPDQVMAASSEAQTNSAANPPASMNRTVSPSIVYSSLADRSWGNSGRTARRSRALRPGMAASCGTGRSS
jgi:hypothetical protein